MDFEFWDNCWHRDSQPFHVFDAHPLLRKHLTTINPKEKLLLPLSGKSLDPIFLAENQIYSTAIEFNPKAVKAFIQENELTPEQINYQNTSEAIQYQFAGYEVWLADFFDLTTNEIGEFSQVFDRAALVALPEEMRAQYIQHLKSLLKPEANIFMVTMDYDPEQMGGPPFYIKKDELKEFFPTASIEELDRNSLLTNHPRWQELNLSKLDEVLYQIKL